MIRSFVLRLASFVFRLPSPVSRLPCYFSNPQFSSSAACSNTMADPPTTHLTPSPFGSKEYWDTTYTSELSQHLSSPEAPSTSTVWFSDTSAAEKVTSYLVSHAPPRASMLDLGTGNGGMLFQLREELGSDKAGRMLGVDYASAGVELARGLGRQRGYAEVGFKTWDIFKGDRGEVMTGEQKDGWDVVLDKGTFDAVSLSEERDGEQQERRRCEIYPDKAAELVRLGGMLVVTSCNWTEEELQGWFDGVGGLAVHHRIKYPSFSFGGGQGQSVCTVVFRRGIEREAET